MNGWLCVHSDGYINCTCFSRVIVIELTISIVIFLWKWMYFLNRQSYSSNPMIPQSALKSAWMKKRVMTTMLMYQ